MFPTDDYVRFCLQYNCPAALELDVFRMTKLSAYAERRGDVRYRTSERPRQPLQKMRHFNNCQSVPLAVDQVVLIRHESDHLEQYANRNVRRKSWERRRCDDKSWQFCFRGTLNS